jgi:hypothetical protein
MAEIHIEEHSSPIKTPRQLVIVVVLAFAVPITLIVSSITGKNAMPPKGGNLSLTDAEVNAAVDYRVSLVK